MNMIRFLLHSTLTMLLLLTSAQLWAETDCSKDAIGFYMDKGFTPAQVTQMCQCSTSSSDNNSTAKAATSTGESANLVAQEQGELLFFSTSILSDTLTVTPDTLTYVIDECIRYGEEDITGFRPKVCAVFKTTISRVGLKVLRAVKGVSIFRDAELLVQGDIKREIVNFNELDSKDQKAIKKIFDPSPETFDIVTRKGADPKKVAARLPRKD
ncbi:MAG: hypothetical protein HOM14_06980 [Gammaproteobacteria bacterium]|jgi:hypothetical protein|nr:hypothetical protein [Gammaproteobacteria bacterium]MBT3724946.1 hypothetical protein [Gammaproteobacteria bacterium]MBT4075582.1 hypothetical protein [Gammaproteobacteria bacterium]MBT4448595.1 hypothetical protein [Gammaproteobacteria bacterium]MBT4861115.1 hypothetical protein [Gammaproteobacteria bacterium]